MRVLFQRYLLLFILSGLSIYNTLPRSADAQDVLPVVTGELKQWHPVTVSLDGPAAEEEGEINPFLDYRMTVTFTQGSTQIVVPGYFAADGNASQTGATAGKTWRAHVVPPTTGEWTYEVSLRAGDDIAISDDTAAGTPATGDGVTGSFSISNTDKKGRDFRGKGMLRYVGGHFLQFDNGEYFIKGGADSPENFLGYYEFDNTRDFGCRNNTLENGLHRYKAHEGDWMPGDPTWHDTKGRGIIGSVNYLSSKGINSIYFLTMNTQGDGCEVYPWTEYGDDAAERLRYDVSKLDQWNIVFDHMDAKGVMLHIVTQETENDQLLDGGDLGTERKLYYRELVARFGYHMAITWNLGEENTNTQNQRKAFADYVAGLDPYGHLISIHTYPNQIGQIYDQMLGYPNGTPVQSLTGNSMQINLNNGIHEQALKWLERSQEMEHPWVVSLDEIGPAGTGVTPDGAGNNHRTVREEALWGTLMAGGAGVEWYFGYNNPHDDLDSEDWRARDDLWTYTAAAVDFLHQFPFTQMESADGLIEGNQDYVFARHGEVYAVYVFDASAEHEINLPDGSYELTWYDPRTGTMYSDDIVTLSGAGPFALGEPPSNTNQDWAARIEAVNVALRPSDTVVSSAAGLQYAYYEGSWDELPAFETLTAVEISVAPVVSLDVSQRDDEFALQFVGFVNAPADGVYTFYVNSDDGARLYIGDQPVVDNDGVHAATEESGSIALQAGLHAFTLIYFEKNGNAALDLSWEQPGMQKEGMDADDFVYDTDNLLPVELTDFQAILDGPTIHITWNTASELNNAGFSVERALEVAGPFAELGFVEGGGTTLSAQSYAFQDPDWPASAPSVYYRLKQVDFDGTISYSETVQVELPLPEAVKLHPNYPDPFNPVTTLSFAIPGAGHVNLSVYDATGRLIEVLLDQTMPAGEHRVAFEAHSSLASGTYLYRLETPIHVRTGVMTLLK